jgi:dienelactone hydrolase
MQLSAFSFGQFLLADRSLLVPEPINAATETPILEPLNRFPRMVQEYFVNRLRKMEAENRKEKESLSTRAEAESYVRSVREKILKCFAPFPEKTPLNPRITGKVERDIYSIEKIIFESRPDFLVTANLYLPKNHKFPLPAVVGSCGHSDNGKANETYQSFAQGLARQGYVVLIFDPIGQGERLQYPDDRLKSRIGAGVREHLYAGNQQLLVGEMFAAWRAWDGIRALDYLFTREEVDPHHVGITGNSGGGTMTTWLCGLDSRWTMAAPSCFVTSLRRNLENELPADIEQCPSRVLSLGLDHLDFITAMAPKPVILLAQEQDFFDVRGTEEAFAQLKKIYRLLDAEENIALFIGPKPHGYSKEIREAMYRWFNRISGISKAQTEPELALEKDEVLCCSPRGQVCELKSRTVFDFTRARSRELAMQRKKPRNAELKRALLEALNINDTPKAPDYRILRPLSSRQYPMPQASLYAVETEPGIQVVVYCLRNEERLSRPRPGPTRAILYVSHHSADAEMRQEPLIRQLLAEDPGLAFYACDVRGIGESQPDTCDLTSFLSDYGNDYFYAAHSLMLGEPYVGQKTHDVLAILEWLKSCGHTGVHLAALGWGTLPATFAAFLSDFVDQITLKRALVSYTGIAESETYSWPLSALLPGILKSFDLPDCYRELLGKKLRQLEPLQS